MKVRFVYARFQRHAEAHPELLEHVPCNEYFGPPSLGIAYMAAVTPPEWELDFRDDRLEDVGFEDEVDLVAISCFTPSAMRAMEIADEFRARGRKVVMGGIFPSAMPDVVGEHADAVVVGEGEGVWAQVLADAASGELKPRYSCEDAFFDPSGLPLPRIDLYTEKEGGKFSPDDYPVQVTRGCPLKCVACAVPLSIGRKMRHMPADHVLGQIDQLAARGKLASFTEDTSFFPNAIRHFGAVLDRIIESGKEAPVSYVGISMPMILATRASMMERLRKAGVKMFYLVGGFDPITQNAFTGKDAQALQRATDVIAKCHDHGIEPYTSFLVGNDQDDEGCFDRILEFGNETGIRKSEFAIRTPYPGTPAWFELEAADRLLHQNWSLYNDANVVFQPAQMSPDRLLEGYLYLWREFYRPRQDLLGLDHRQRTIQF